MTKKASYITLGCKLNYAETSTYERNFIKEGYESVPWTEKADLYVINTCSVTEHADRKSRNIIRKIHRTAPEATVIVTGCYAQLKRAEVEALDGVSLVFGADEKSSLVKTTLEFIGGRESVPQDLSANDTFAAYSSGEERTRSFLKVQDGCDNFCAYCTVPFARGCSRSISIATAVEEAKKIAAAGVKEMCSPVSIQEISEGRQERVFWICSRLSMRWKALKDTGFLPLNRTFSQTRPSTG